MHTLNQHLSENPECTSCHNVHASADARLTMVDNRSEGCRQCHDLVAMASNPKVSAKAISYHKTMTQADRSCLDCHQHIAHAPSGSVSPNPPQSLAQRRLTLFYPAQSDLDWLLTEHPGAQMFRQGRACQQCHRGEEPTMGQKLAGTRPNPTRDVDVNIQRQQQNLVMTLSWRGAEDDADVAIMWGQGGNTVFQRSGCWAACHSDMPGMSRDRGQGLSKYLSVARKEEQLIGRPPQMRDAKELADLVAANNYVQLWRVKLNGGKTPEIEMAQLLDKIDWQTTNNAKASARFKDGLWQVQISRPIDRVHQPATFGIAIHGPAQKGAEHWVSLPQTFAIDANDVDFTLQ